MHRLPEVDAEIQDHGIRFGAQSNTIAGQLKAVQAHAPDMSMALRPDPSSSLTASHASCQACWRSHSRTARSTTTTTAAATLPLLPLDAAAAAVYPIADVSPPLLLLLLLLQCGQYLIHAHFHDRLACLGAPEKVMLLVTALLLRGGGGDTRAEHRHGQ
jgi:hypothetical protein